MGKHNEVFKRYEKKYILSSWQYDELLSIAGDKVEDDGFAYSAIGSLYFDTPDYFLIRRSLEKPVYKEKLRLRSYGVPGPGDKVFLELKKKFKGIVYKRRVEMPLRQAAEYMAGEDFPRKSSQVLSEIDWFRRCYPGLEARMYIYCDRYSLKGTEDGGLRITFDENILWREEELRLSDGPWGSPLLEEGQRLMEIKLPGAMPLWLARALDELQIYPQSFSKYGNAYLASGTGGKPAPAAKGGIICA